MPAGSRSVTFKIWGGSGGVDMYEQFNGTPGNASTICQPDPGSSAETCTIDAPAAGTYYVNVRAYAGYSGVSLKGTIN